MSHLAQQLWRKGFVAWLATFGLAAMVIGCGGGTDTASNGVGVGGTGTAASGLVTGYGSLIVNNVRFDVDDANFADEDGTRITPVITDRPVGLGAVVDIRSGGISRNSDDDDVATATVVTLISAIKGPIEGKGSSSLTVLGQTVHVNAATLYDQDQGLNGLAVGNNVEVYGYQDSNGDYLATRIEKQVSLFYKLRGRVATLGDNRSFTLGDITIDTSSVQNNMPNLQVGDLVRVRLTKTPLSNGAYQAVIVVPVERNLASFATTHIEGLVSDFTSLSAVFKVDGVPVSASNNVVTGSLSNNQRVKVDGSVRNGVLVATRVVVDDEAEDDRRFKLIGVATGLNLGTQTFSLKGLTVNYATAEIRDNRPIAEVNNHLVEVEGKPSGNGTGFVATRIRLR
jgi:Domain of unknown function (DUF5666)